MNNKNKNNNIHHSYYCYCRSYCRCYYATTTLSATAPATASTAAATTTTTITTTATTTTTVADVLRWLHNALLENKKNPTRSPQTETNKNPTQKSTTWTHKQRLVQMSSVLSPRTLPITYNTPPAISSGWAISTHTPTHSFMRSMAENMKKKGLNLDVLYHTMPHTPCRFEVNDVHSLQCFA